MRVLAGVAGGDPNALASPVPERLPQRSRLQRRISDSYTGGDTGTFATRSVARITAGYPKDTLWVCSIGQLPQ